MSTYLELFVYLFLGGYYEMELIFLHKATILLPFVVCMSFDSKILSRFSLTIAVYCCCHRLGLGRTTLQSCCATFVVVLSRYPSHWTLTFKIKHVFAVFWNCPTYMHVSPQNLNHVDALRVGKTRKTVWGWPEFASKQLLWNFVELLKVSGIVRLIVT